MGFLEVSTCTPARHRNGASPIQLRFAYDRLDEGSILLVWLISSDEVSEGRIPGGRQERDMKWVG